MQSVVVYGRLLARAFFSGFGSDLQQQSYLKSVGPGSASRTKHVRPLGLVTAFAGLGKTQSQLSTQLRSLGKWSFGDDACFIAGNTLGDVIGG